MNAHAPRTPHQRDHSDEVLRAELADLLPPPPVPELAPDRDRDLRHTVMRTALASEGRAVARPSRARRGRAGLRLGWIAAPVAACAVVAGVAVLAPRDTPSGSPGTGRSSAGQPASPGAVQVLSRAALAAAVAPAPDAGPEGYVYVKSLVAHAGRDASGGSATLPPAHQREVWLSADGSRPGLLREPGSADTPLGAPLPVYELDHRGATPRKSTLGAEPPSVMNPTHAYVATLPTDPEALLRLIRAETRRAGSDPDQRAFTVIGTLLAETWAPPKVTAALYEAAARIPGSRCCRPRRTRPAARASPSPVRRTASRRSGSSTVRPRRSSGSARCSPGRRRPGARARSSECRRCSPRQASAPPATYRGRRGRSGAERAVARGGARSQGARRSEARRVGQARREAARDS